MRDLVIAALATPSTRLAVCKALGISSEDAQAIIKRALLAGIVRRVGSVPTVRGRPLSLYQSCPGGSPVPAKPRSDRTRSCARPVTPNGSGRIALENCWRQG